MDAVWVLTYLAPLVAAARARMGWGFISAALAIAVAAAGFLLSLAAPAFTSGCDASAACSGNVATGLVFGGLLAFALALVPGAILLIRFLMRSGGDRVP